MYKELNLFYCDYVNDEEISSSDPLSTAIHIAVDYMQNLSVSDGSFLGIITPEKNIVQFIYNEKHELILDIPDEDRIASYTKQVTMEECLQIIRDTFAGKNPYEIKGLSY